MVAASYLGETDVPGPSRSSCSRRYGLVCRGRGRSRQQRKRTPGNRRPVAQPPYITGIMCGFLHAVGNAPTGFDQLPKKRLSCSNASADPARVEEAEHYSNPELVYRRLGGAADRPHGGGELGPNSQRSTGRIRFGRLADAGEISGPDGGEPPYSSFPSPPRRGPRPFPRRSFP